MIRTQRCDRNVRRSNLRFLHETATYILFCFCFVSLLVYFCCFLIYIKYALAGYIITPRTMPSLYPSLIFIYFFSLHEKKKEHQLEGPYRRIIGYQRGRKLGKSPIVRTVKGWRLQNLPFNWLKVKKAKEVYQLEFQVCRPWKSRVKNQIKAENVCALTSRKKKLVWWNTVRWSNLACVTILVYYTFTALNRQLNFWGFAKSYLILRISYMRTQQTQYATGVAYKPGLSNTHGHTIVGSSSQLSAK